MKQRFHIGQKVRIVKKVEYEGPADYTVWEDELDNTLGEIGVIIDVELNNICNLWIYDVETNKDSYDWAGYKINDKISWWYLGESLEPENNLIKYLI